MSVKPLVSRFPFLLTLLPCLNLALLSASGPSTTKRLVWLLYPMASLLKVSLEQSLKQGTWELVSCLKRSAVRLSHVCLLCSYLMPKSAFAGGHASVRAEILKIPGVGAGSPTDSDWQKVGEMCLGATKENVAISAHVMCGFPRNDAAIVSATGDSAGNSA